MNEPIEVTVTNRGDTAATGPGLILGTIGLIFAFCLIGMVVAIGLLILIPTVLVAAFGWLLIRIGRINEAHTEYCKQMGFEELEW